MPVASSISERSGTSLVTYWIPSIMDCHIAFFDVGAAGGSGSFSSAPIMKRKLMASIKKDHASPSALMTNPAGVGPAIVANCVVVSDIDDAATTCSRFKKKRRNECDA